MKFLISGYYGFNNAGDEAVLAAMLEALGERSSGETEFIITAGNTAETARRHAQSNAKISPIPRQHPASLAAAMRACDAFISGGGSLLQDATSLRNVVYYTTLLRVAALSGKPVMIYAQGIGPLRRRSAQKLTRNALRRANVVTLRDTDSLDLLRRIGVSRDCEVTADPVWALTPEVVPKLEEPVWTVNLRPWSEKKGADLAQVTQAILATAQAAGFPVRFLPMQPGVDAPLCQVSPGGRDICVELGGAHPRRVMAEAGAGQLMIAMRLHALIFAAAQGVPCVAIDYDPKVAAFAKLLGAPLVEAAEAGDPAVIARAVAAAKPPATELLNELKAKALRNADLAVGLARRST